MRTTLRSLVTIMAMFALSAPALPRFAAAMDADELLSREHVLRDQAVPLKEDGNIRLALKDWPIFGDISRYAAKMALAARFQGKYAEAHSALIDAKGKLSDQAIREILKGAGVDVAKASADLAAHQPEIDAVLERNDAQARALGFRGTPAFIIGTFRVPGVLSETDFKQAIKDARAMSAGK
jgi:protein-disulfide isomerase